MLRVAASRRDSIRGPTRGCLGNRYGIPAYYALHMWAWRLNPHGVFMDWNPRVSCEGDLAQGP